MQKQDSPVETLLTDVRKKLVETGTRNRLVHVNRKNARGNLLNIVNERSDDVFSILVLQGKKMGFQPLLEDINIETDEDDSPLLELIDKEPDFDPARYTDQFLEVKTTADKLQKRLLKLFRDARTAEEEQGVNILYLALGFLRWYEDESSEVLREAPLVLLPVELRRNVKTSTYDIIARDDDISENISLKERLEGDFGMQLPELSADNAEFSPSSYFECIEETLQAKPRWSVDRDGIQLGFFSFAKLLMLRDLDPENWPGSSLTDHPLISGLLHEGFEPEPSLFADNTPLDKKFSPVDIIQVVDADTSQTKVIEEVRSGRNLVVQGPPGTGKSQTITNIIAAAAHDGKRVLFVAEKMAALNVVHARLVKVGLRDVCLELHSRTANKKMVLRELARTLASGAAIPRAPASPDRLKQARDSLNLLSDLLHTEIGSSGETPFGLIGVQAKYHGEGMPPPTIAVDKAGQWSKDEANQIAALVKRYIEAQEQVGITAEHPFRGVQALKLQPTDLDRLSLRLEPMVLEVSALTELGAAIALHIGSDGAMTLHYIKKLRKILGVIGKVPAVDGELLDVATSMGNSNRTMGALEAGAKWQLEKAARNHIYNDIAWTSNVGEYRAALVQGRDSFFARLGRKYKSASSHLAGLLASPMPKSADERLKLLDGILQVQKLRREVSDEKAYLQEILGVVWRGGKTAFKDILLASKWVEELKSCGVGFSEKQTLKLAALPKESQSLISRVNDRLPAVDRDLNALLTDLSIQVEEAFSHRDINEVKLADISAFLSGLGQEKSRYAEWVELAEVRNQLTEFGLESLLAVVDDGSLSAANAVAEFNYARAESLWKAALREQPDLQQLAGMDRQNIVDLFQTEERQRFLDTVTQIRVKHLSALPQGALGEMGVIRGEIGKKVRHKPIRQLMTTAGQAIQRIKPVFLMSPISVAQFLPPGKLEFDLLVIDEASQVRPEEALGSIARAKQIVVVGDQKQLPPSSFFDRLTANEEQDNDDDVMQGVARASELESVLSLCEARGLPRSMLEWHYRSRDPSLISVSNAEFYEHKLILPPTPLQNDDDYGLSFTHVAGAYDRGGKRVNRIEAEAIVDRVVEHAKKTPELSLGIVTFSAAQASMVTELLEYERRKNLILEAFLREGKPEDVFVKNIENVQGDERDVIMVSVGYGPVEPNGPLTSMSFGPVNAEGGERRLNVLFTRSRIRCEVFASFHPGDIDLSRVSKGGPRVLKRFLEFAKTGVLDERRPMRADADSPFEEDVAREIQNLGFLVDHQVGSAGFLIDLGVRHPEMPGKYLLAVECDGASYHSALSARERDRLRQGVLENLGWRFHRIWSTDWFYRRSEEIARLSSVLQQVADISVPMEGANIGAAPKLIDGKIVAEGASNEEAVDEEGSKEKSFTITPPVERTFPAYKRCLRSVNSQLEPHQVEVEKLAQLVAIIIQIEGPIHESELARRVANCFGKERAGNRIVEATLNALSIAKQSEDNSVVCANQFWMTTKQKANPPIRNRSQETGALIKAEYLPPEEIRAALDVAIVDNVGGTRKELIRAAALMMGFKRVGPDLHTAFERQL